MGESGRVVVVGTAGHVDHGKSALVHAITGTNPDRLAEEKARGLTIDLGFAWCELPHGTVASFVDVPGHEDFVRNMLAGAGGVDAVVLVVAADEGPMPQTREHLAILDLLRVEHGVIAVTKSDAVEPDWLELVVAETRALVADTTLRSAPIVAVSAVTGAGLDEFRATLETVLARVPDAEDLGRPRLAIDRAFSMSGFGTVVTGTLRDGSLHDGDAVIIEPSGRRARIRGLQSRGRAVATARPGTRTAVNLAGLSADDLGRGEVVTLPGILPATSLVDVVLALLSSAPRALEHDDEVQVFHGSAEVGAHVRIVGGRRIAPGSRGWAQLRLEHEVALAAGDRFVMRQPSPAVTIGGGRVLDPIPPGRRRRLRSETLSRFEALDAADRDDVAWYMLSEREPCAAAALEPNETGLEPSEREAALASLAATGRAQLLGTLWMTDAGWRGLRTRAETVLKRHHSRHPLRPGVPPEELRERLSLTPPAFSEVVDRAVDEAWLARDGGSLRLPTHVVAFAPAVERDTADLLTRFRARPYTPPTYKDAEGLVGAEVLGALIQRGELVHAGPDVLFDREAYNEMLSGVLAHIDKNGSVTVADVRDTYLTSRKYALALLEHLDRVRVTRRVGDARVKGAAAAADNVT